MWYSNLTKKYANVIEIIQSFKILEDAGIDIAPTADAVATGKSPAAKGAVAVINP